jgi:hypothetical protein
LVPVPKKPREGKKFLADEIRSFKRNPGFGEVTAIQPFATAKTQTDEAEKGPRRLLQEIF